MAPELDIVAGRYVLESEISRGGMATVWRARDEILARPVAAKVLHPHLSEDEAFLERFRREAVAAARLSHPNIVSIFDTGSEPPKGDGPHLQFIVMELCAGGTLADLVAGGKSVEPARVVAIGTTICQALGYAHRQGVIHRDVKPANVLIAGDGLLKVADFGIARAAFVKGDLTTTGSIIGTVTYLSPEQGQGHDPDHRSDLYGLGVVLYELLVGRPPFSGETEIGTALMHLKEPPPRPRSIRAGVPRQLEAVILKALEKEPADRFADADEMAAALANTAPREGATLATPTIDPAPPIATAPPSRRSGDVGWILRVIAAVAVTIALAVFVSSLLDGGGGGETTEPPEEGGRASPSAVAAAELEVASVSDFDPYGGDGEHPEEAPAAVDGDVTTSWTTQTYSSSLQAQGKPGVGLVFDLGQKVEVTEVRIQGSPGIDVELRSADSIGADEQAFAMAADKAAAPATFTLSPAQGAARYWLIWITEIGPAGGTASIAEVEFRG